MSALKKYRQSLRVRAAICDDLLVGADLADAAIAELQAERGAAMHMVQVAYAKLKAENERLKGEATDLLDAIFQTVDPEEGEDIVAEAFPKGGPQWVLDWYFEHPNEEEAAARERMEP